MSLTVQILLSNNSETISQTLSCITNDCEIQLVDVGCKDNTVQICNELGFKVINGRDVKNRSQLRTNLCQRASFDWQLWLEPYETINFKQLTDLAGDGYYLRVVKPNVMTHEVRLWNRKTNYRINNPVCEHVQIASPKFIDCSIQSNSDKFITKDDIANWKSLDPSNQNISYYDAMLSLYNKEYQDFLNKGAKYCFSKRSVTKEVLIIKYYSAIVYTHIKHDPKSAIKELLPCLAAKPAMAEYWCQLADIHFYTTKEYEKAKRFYHIAQLAGIKRDILDLMPIEFPKYDEYPRSMITRCEALMSESKFVKLSTSIAN